MNADGSVEVLKDVDGMRVNVGGSSMWCSIFVQSRHPELQCIHYCIGFLSCFQPLVNDEERDNVDDYTSDS